jgi:transposase-like protein
MNAATEAIEREDEGEEISYVGVARRYGVDESTLRRRHQDNAQHVQRLRRQDKSSTPKKRKSSASTSTP